jgi:GntR family transcriptional repressor for pyruvate dehydrogenase complex
VGAPAGRDRRHAPAFQVIVEKLRDEIIQGRRAAGDRLPPEQVLADQFYISRTGIREALRVLESQGLVEIRHGYGGGVFVREAGLDPVLGALDTTLRLGKFDVSELYQARLALEPGLAALAAERAAGDFMRRLEENVQAAHGLIDRGMDAFGLNLEFHTILAEGAGNRVLGLFMRSVVELLERIDREYPTNRAVSRQAVDDHESLIEALRAGDGAAASTKMTLHLEQLEDRFEAIQRELRRRRRAGDDAIPSWSGAETADGSA